MAAIRTSLSDLEFSATQIESDDEQFLPPPRSWFESSTPISKEANLTDDVVASEITLDFRDDATDRIPYPEENNYTVGGEKQGTANQPYTLHQSHPVGNTQVLPSPSWREISSQVLPAAAKELLSSSLRRIYYTARLSYARGRWHRKYSDIGNNAGGFAISSSALELPENLTDLPPFSSLSWIDRQLVQEWRTYLPGNKNCDETDENEELDFARARTLVPNPFPRPPWRKLDICFSCHKSFGPTRLRHHCRVCGNSFCQSHSSSSHSLPHLGYDPDVAERVCDNCKQTLMEQNLAERVAWRLARCRDYSEGNLTPYFETGFDSAEQVAIRITKAAINLARAIPLGAQATVAVETLEVLRKHGLTGIYGIMLREEFMAAADLLRRALGINKDSWPLSVHELSAAIFYSFAQHRAIRGLSPEYENLIHAIRAKPGHKSDSAKSSPVERGVRDESPRDFDNYEQSALSFRFNATTEQTDAYDPSTPIMENPSDLQLPFDPVCDPVSDSVISSLLFYAPIALNFIYADKPVDMQLLAAQQGWRLLYAFLEQEAGHGGRVTDRPASAIFVHQENKIACLAVRGTATIHDVITDIRQIPVPFPDSDPEHPHSEGDNNDDDWTSIFRGQGFALSGMASAAVNLFREHIDSLGLLAKQGYRIRITGHSLGGGVATMVGVLVLRHLKRSLGSMGEYSGRLFRDDEGFVRVYTYGTPSCVDSKLAESVAPFVTAAVLHDDVFPRLTPTSCRGLLKHLLYVRETWVKTHLSEDLLAIRERAKTAWAPRFRQGFTLTSPSKSIKQYCRQQIAFGKARLLSAKGKLARTNNMDAVSGGVNQEKDVASVDSIEIAASDATNLDPTSHDTELEDELSSACQQEGLKGGCDDNRDETEELEPQLLLEFLGGVGSRTQGIIIDGDEFFDSGENLVESDEDDNDSYLAFANAVSEIPKAQESNGDSWSMDIHGAEGIANTSLSFHTDDNSFSKDDKNDAVLLEETSLPKMFVPGKIVHIYSHRGVYKATFVPRTFRELRHISMAGNMLADHTTKAYYESLLEVQTARTAVEGPPRWVAFDEDDTW